MPVRLNPQTAGTKTFKQVMLWGLLLVCVLLLITRLSALFQPDQLAADDFAEYWSAGRLNALGDNPYSPDLIKDLETKVGKPNAPLMMLNPPWTLVILMPFGLLLYPISRAAWFLISISIIFACATLIWEYYDAPRKKAWMAWVAGFLFAPTLQVIKVGQIGPFLLLGLVGFLYFAKREKWALAGASAALITLKPHLSYLFLLAILLWSLQRRKWKVLGSLVITVTIALAIAWSFNPSIINQYIFVSLHSPVKEYATATWGTFLRSLFGERRFWLQFVAPGLGAAWLLVYWWRKRNIWSWSEQTPFIILVSIATTAYGWTFDQVVLVIPMVLAALWAFRHGWSARLAYLYLPYLVLNILMTLLPLYQADYWWVGMGFLVWYLWAQKWLAGDWQLSRQKRDTLERVP